MKPSVMLDSISMILAFMMLSLIGCQNKELTRAQPDIYPRGYVSFATEIGDYGAGGQSMGATTLFSVVNIYEVQGGNETKVGQMKGEGQPYILAAKPGIHSYIVEYEGLSERVQFNVFEEKVTAVSIRFSKAYKETLSSARLIDPSGETVYYSMNLYVWAPQPYRSP